MPSSYSSQANSLIDQLRTHLQSLPESTRAQILSGLTTTTKDERSDDIERKRAKRTEAARIEIPDCVNPQRRERCLAEPALFLKTYFPKRYTQPFGKLHYHMMEAIHDRARYGGKKAIAAPRGKGKSEIVKGMNAYVVCAELVRFPLIICATTALAQKNYKDFKQKFATNDLLLEDFPEICAPIRDLEGAPLRAAKQHIDGVLTGISWKATGLRFPDVPGSPYGGIKMAYFGMDAAFRGLSEEGDRPDFVIIDDPETSESARSLQQVEDRSNLIERDIVGMEGQDRRMAIVMLTTIQNRYCLSFQFTDRTHDIGKPAFAGSRYGWVEKWPKHEHMWEEYMSLRRKDQQNGDEYGRTATAYYLANREEMDEGAEMLADNYKPLTVDGEELVHSALQEAYDKIADTDIDSFRTEYQNDPTPEEEIQTLGLTAARVQSRTSDLMQREAPTDTEVRIVGIDIGKYHSHWVDTAWRPGAIGDVVDYGVVETHGLSVASDSEAVEKAQLAALEVWAEDVVAGIEPQLVLIDSGTFTEAVYEFCRRWGAPFFPSKGWDSGRFRVGSKTKTRKPFYEAYASKIPEARVWLYNVNTEFWKRWAQERFVNSPYMESGERSEGSLLLYSDAGDTRRHLSFAHHMTAEEEQLQPVYGKELKRVWFVKNRNNHWLDAMALGCAGAGIMGIRTTQPEPVKPAPPRLTNKQAPPVTPYGKPYVYKR